MAIAFVLINTKPTVEQIVYTRLSNVPEIIELYQLFGEYDLIAKIEAVDFEKLGEIVISKIRAIDGVSNTKTLAIINA